MYIISMKQYVSNTFKVLDMLHSFEKQPLSIFFSLFIEHFG